MLWIRKRVYCALYASHNIIMTDLIHLSTKEVICNITVICSFSKHFHWKRFDKYHNLRQRRLPLLVSKDLRRLFATNLYGYSRICTKCKLLVLSISSCMYEYLVTRRLKMQEVRFSAVNYFKFCLSCFASSRSTANPNSACIENCIQNFSWPTNPS